MSHGMIFCFCTGTSNCGLLLCAPWNNIRTKKCAIPYRGASCGWATSPSSIRKCNQIKISHRSEMQSEIDSSFQVLQYSTNKLKMLNCWRMHKLRYKINTVRKIWSRKCEILQCAYNVMKMTRIIYRVLITKSNSLWSQWRGHRLTIKHLCTIKNGMSLMCFWNMQPISCWWNLNT